MIDTLSWLQSTTCKCALHIWLSSGLSSSEPSFNYWLIMPGL